MGSSLRGHLLGITCSMSACFGTQTGQHQRQTVPPRAAIRPPLEPGQLPPSLRAGCRGSLDSPEFTPEARHTPQCLVSLPPGLAQWQDPSAFSHAVNTPSLHHHMPVFLCTTFLTFSCSSPNVCSCLCSEVEEPASPGKDDFPQPTQSPFQKQVQGQLARG